MRTRTWIRIVFGVWCILVSSICCAQAAVADKYVHGIDVYSGDGIVDWTVAKNAGTEFAFIKATEGVGFVDKKFATNMKEATAAGVLVGPYHFCRIDSRNGEKFASYDGEPFARDSEPYLDATEEVHAFLEVVMPYYESGCYLPPVADVEGLPKFGDAKLEKIFISNWMHVFSDGVRDGLGVRPIIYTSKSGANRRYTAEFAVDHELWLAVWRKTGIDEPPVESDTPQWKPWLFWQWSATGTVLGVPGDHKGDCDKDVFRGTRDELAALLIHRDAKSTSEAK